MNFITLAVTNAGLVALVELRNGTFDLSRAMQNFMGAFLQPLPPSNVEDGLMIEMAAAALLGLGH